MRRRFLSSAKIKNPSYLSFEALEDDFAFACLVPLEYKVDEGYWMSLSKTQTSIKIKKGQRFFIRGRNISTNMNFRTNVACNVSGRLLSIIYGDECENYNEIPKGASFKEMFKDSMVCDCSGLILPTNVTENCYESMFENCFLMTKAPTLPATVLDDYCYATMFYSCKNLRYIKMLAINTAYGALSGWVANVSSTGTFVVNKDAVWDTAPGVLHDNGVPTGWNVINEEQENGFIPDHLSRGVYIEDIDGYLHTEHGWDGSKVANGIAVLTNNCKFVMALQDAYTSSCQWGSYGISVSGITTTISEAEALADYDGEAQTTTILGELGNSPSVDDAPAAYYCRAFTFPNGKKGYLGAAGEWKDVIDNYEAISLALSKCGGSDMSFYWTSTQFGSDDSWSISFGSDYLEYVSKIANSFVRAFTSLKFDVQENGGKVVNKITAVLSSGSHNEITIKLSTRYPVASDVVGHLVTSSNSDIFIIEKDSSSKDLSNFGEFQDLYLQTTEDDTYIYELVIES